MSAQVDLCGEVSRAIDLPGYGLPVGRHRPNLAVGDRLPERVVRPDLDLGDLTWQVVGAIGSHRDRERRQLVPADADVVARCQFPAIHFFIERHFDPIQSQPCVLRNPPVGARHTEA